MFLLMRFMRGATIELLGVAAFLFVFSLARPDVFSELAAAFAKVAPTSVVAATSDRDAAEPPFSFDDWRPNDAAAERSDYVAEQLGAAGDALMTLAANHLSQTWEDLAADRR